MVTYKPCVPSKGLQNNVQETKNMGNAAVAFYIKVLENLELELNLGFCDELNLELRLFLLKLTYVSRTYKLCCFQNLNLALS